ncbi:MAG: response regulator receiver modulated CheB methylesterase [Chthoniobacteraceae bacterium]|nr:response regulator receiver modulated CheB methylesterase [Chthoniobacteraceae bacterium]
MTDKIRILVADDSALMRRTLTRLIERDPELEVIGTARDGEDVVTKARQLRPDVITMDINMPKCDGITALQQIVEESICAVVMVSSLTHKDAVTTFEALELGAFDYVLKPEGTVSSNLTAVEAELIAKLKFAASSQSVRKLARRHIPRESVIPATAVPEPICKPVKNAFGYKAVAIGISTGGPSTLSEFLPLLPRDLPAALFLVQHMPARFIPAFAERLDRSSRIRVVAAESGMTVEAGTCYVAKGDCQLGLLHRMNGEVVIRTPQFPKTLFMPSVSEMMRSVHAVYGPETIGVLMTGIGDDGADMMVRIRESGGLTIAESDETAVVFGMPRKAIEMGGAQVIAPSFRIAEELLKAF